eukprot:tig00000254_g22569.t1
MAECLAIELFHQLQSVVSRSPELEARARNALYAAFAGDALALGVHWEYNPDAIKEKYGTPDRLIKARMRPDRN